VPLIKCPVCGKEISDEAIACPGCGHPVREVEHRVSEITFYETGRKEGSAEHKALLNAGWKVVNESRYDLVDPYGHCYAEVYKYNLQRYQKTGAT